VLRDAARSLAVALVLVIACRQITLHGGYAPHPGYRAQVDALLAGRLALTTAPEGLVHDLAWTPTGVHQVWGLGVPLWQAPFEAVGRAIGIAPFPDRVPLVVWLAVMLLVVTRAFRPHASGARPGDSRWPQLGAVVITALAPVLITVLRGRIGVYEEAAIYAYAAAIILLGGLVALHRTPTPARYLVLVGLAGLTGLIRPTVWFYGLATLVVASAIVWRRLGATGAQPPPEPAAAQPRRRARRGPGHRVRVVALGGALFVAGGGALFATNAARFGRGSEFGHRLNLHSLPGNIVATRFSYPFERAGNFEAAAELVGSLFDRPEQRNKRGFYQVGLHRGQSALPRWREYYFTTFSWPYLPAILVGLWLGARAWRRRGDPRARLIATWAVLGAGPLCAFYLRSPSMASRYQLDLAPAIAALLVVAWWAAAARWPRAAPAGLAALWLAAVVTGKTTRPRDVSDPVGRDAAAAATYAITRPVAYDHPLPGAYDLADPLLPTWTDAATDYARCSDLDGARIACDAPPLPGDVAVLGHRIGRQWYVEHHAIREPALELASRADPPRDHGAAHDAPAGGQAAAAHGRQDAVCRATPEDRDAAPVGRAVPTALTDPAAVLERSYLTPPTLYLNGFGWRLSTGDVPPATLFYVDDPAYIALDVVGAADTDWDRAARVAIGLVHLPLAAVASTATGARLRFAIPPGARLTGLRVAFVAFGPDRELDQPRSRFGLRSIRWRDP
jgi:hypothetical protein